MIGQAVSMGSAAPTAIASLSKDWPRNIDRFIDYFGEWAAGFGPRPSQSALDVLHAYCSVGIQLAFAGRKLARLVFGKNGRRGSAAINRRGAAGAENVEGVSGGNR